MTDRNSKQYIRKKIAVLGSTGSVGKQTLDVAEKSGAVVTALSASSSVKQLEEQIRKFHPRVCAVKSERAGRELRTLVSDTNTEVIFGENAAEYAASLPDTDIVFNSTSGIAGLYPTLAAINAGHDVALANKETLVAAGEIVMNAAAENGVRILPVDSEHCAVFQCINDSRNGKNSIKNVILTASGGPFRGYTAEKLSAVTKEQALSHPTWKMGPKITIDCATLMNKGLEVIEAARLYSLEADRIKVVVHPESIIHSMVEYIDNAVLAQLAVPDMRMCISYALNYPERGEAVIKSLDLTEIGTLSFHKPDMDVFPLLSLAYSALRRGGIIPCVLNAANERAVELFLAGKISSITDIFGAVIEAVEKSVNVKTPSIDDIKAADRESRILVDNFIAR
jgi:1-deoxy-D-xylulose 5-phosphate reductoisomerase